MAEQYFEKKYHFKRFKHDWKLPDPDTMFKVKKWALPELMTFKENLNRVKAKLNDYPSEKWHKHTTAMNPAGAIQREIRLKVDPELLTQAWCKFFETVNSFDLIPAHSRSTKELHTVHLCEAPGAFVASLNHYLNMIYPDIKWNWMATTLNPHHEGNDPSQTIFDDRLIIPTENFWTFGDDQTGDILIKENMCHILKEAKQRGLGGNGTLLLVTADGSIDCQFNPGEQESLVCPLHLCEATTALLLLDKGGSLVLKVFTLFEAENVCLLYLLACSFETLVMWKPATSREGNSETYLVCMNYCGQNNIKPWLDVLSANYGQSFSVAPMFSFDSIPKTFLDQATECAKTFMNFQVDVIERNIEAFENRDRGHKGRGKASTVPKSYLNLRYLVTKEFFFRYQPQPIPEESKLTVVNNKASNVNSVKWLHNLYDVSGQFSYNQKIKHKRQECESLEIWESLCEALNNSDEILKEYSPSMAEENHPSLEYAGMSCKVAPLDYDLTMEDVVIGLPLEKILISKFCHNWLLCLNKQIQSLLKQLKEASKNRSALGNEVDRKRLSKYDCEGERMKQVKMSRVVNQSTLSDIDIVDVGTQQGSSTGMACSAQNDPENIETNSFSIFPSSDACNSLSGIIEHCHYFAWSRKIGIGHLGGGLQELTDILKNMEENGNLLIQDVFPLLTRTHVGVVYLLSKMFQQVWFSWPSVGADDDPKGTYSILLNRRYSNDVDQVKVLKYLEEITKLALDEESKTTPHTLMALVPMSKLCEGDFYECILRLNHHILKAKAQELLDECSEELRKQKNN